MTAGQEQDKSHSIVLYSLVLERVAEPFNVLGLCPTLSSGSIRVARGRRSLASLYCMPRRPWFHSIYLNPAFIFGLELWVGCDERSEIILSNSSRPSLYARPEDNLPCASVRRWRERAAF